MVEKSDVDLLRDITDAFNDGEERYWIDGYSSYSQVRRVAALLLPEFPEAKVTEYSNDPDACVFTATNAAVDISEMERVARERNRLIALGQTNNLPR